MTFDYDLIVIGAGSGGLAAAERAATYGARVAIAEQSKPGGACVNFGCIPEKLLDYAASFHRLHQVAASYGWHYGECRFDWSAFVTAQEHHIHHLNDVHLHHLQSAGVTLVAGQASFVDAHTVMVGDRPLTADKILIAVGARAVKPALPGIEHTITWHELYHLPAQPQRLVLVGADPIGVKIAGSLNALGSQVTHIIPEERILHQLDAELANEIQNRLMQKGVTVFNHTHVKQIDKLDETLQVMTGGNHLETIAVDAVIMDVPRKPYLEGLHLEKVGLQLTASGAIRVDEFSRTTQANIFAVGDCTDRMPLTPSAIAQGRAFADTEFGNNPHPPALEWIPMSISSHPEAATVGFSEAQAREKWGDAVVCYRTQFRPLLYCLAGCNEYTFLKAIVNQHDEERILGIHMIGDGAVEIIQSLALALRRGATKADLDAAIGIHPSSGEELFSLSR